MLFNSFTFIFLYLPVAVAGFFLLGRIAPVLAALWLGAASLFFYGFWAWSNTALLIGSILFNYFCGRWMSGLAAAGRTRQVKLTLAVAVAANLVCLGYYKYSGFLADALSQTLGIPVQWGLVVLPLGISFFTFTQIAFLVDAARGHVREPRFDHYLLFVTYFPHLIAGPILHHAEIMPQFSRRSTYRPKAEAFALGATLFILGLFKKVVIADSIGSYSDAFFAAVPARAPTLLDAWAGALCYTFQIYFDFSAYMDMAIGISLLFNVRLPANFDSPYKARSIIDFWRRWHMTLSRFLRDYLYIPLGGSRKSVPRRYVNLMVTMLLGGLWHGAGWTFVVWGGLHGFYLVLNHGWRFLRRRFPQQLYGFRGGAFISWLITFAAVVVAWVFFRAPDMDTAFGVLKGMAGLNGTHVPAGAISAAQVRWLALGFFIAVFMPNLRQLFRGYELTLPSERDGKDGQAAGSAPAWLCWRQDLPWAAALVCGFIVSLTLMTKVSQFLYFQF